MRERKFRGWITLGIAVLTFFLGYTFKWVDYRLSQKKLQIDVLKESRQMRDSIEEKMAILLKLAKEMGQETDERKKTENKMQFDLLRDDLVTLEKKCAEFEERQPRDLFKIVIPSPPTGIGLSDK